MPELVTPTKIIKTEDGKSYNLGPLTPKKSISPKRDNGSREFSLTNFQGRKTLDVILH